MKVNDVEKDYIEMLVEAILNREEIELNDIQNDPLKQQCIYRWNKEVERLNRARKKKLKKPYLTVYNNIK